MELDARYLNVSLWFWCFLSSHRAGLTSNPSLAVVTEAVMLCSRGIGDSAPHHFILSRVKFDEFCVPLNSVMALTLFL